MLAPGKLSRKGQLMFMVMGIQDLVVMYPNEFLEGLFRLRRSQVTVEMLGWLQDLEPVPLVIMD